MLGLQRERIPRKASQRILFDSENGNRIGLPARQFRAATHDLDIARVAEQAVAFLSS
jgi:hypothetical protein